MVMVRDYSGNQFRSEVKDIASVTTGRSRTYTVTVSLSSTLASNYRIGEAVVVDFIAQSSEQTLSVPTSALVDRDSSPAIYLVKDNQAILTPVKLYVFIY